ncbi:ABC transporter permease [Philodulcilactobacillus myokoensis]|uniref:Putative hemin transport system permease protein HrtB n=1 Tax=Philodulcilactobacillus myokoensis TaxID=2929573 RepID=A0A9W6AZ73_9LACO|nr:FtsX-like permease family protein [Philodulcilactobacillus myokoensis]GLB46247.1 ABC transporter permease [Philodulcilactobacillus myokoensis]
MFLAIKEMKHSKFRYGLIITVIVLIAYLIFVLTGLAYGLAESNRQAIDSWNANQVVLNSDADGALQQSTITSNQAKQIKSQPGQAQIGQISVNAQKKNQKTSASMVGINSNQFIYQNVNIIQGRKFKHQNEVIVDQSMVQNNGYHLGDHFKVSNNSPTFKIVGITKNAKLNVAPVIYSSMGDFRKVKFGSRNVNNISAVIMKHNLKQGKINGLEKISIQQMIQKIPGYSAQNSTFIFMIGFLLLITVIIIAIFLYILTMQKIPYFAVLKVQGIATKYLVKNVIGQSLLITILGIIISGILTGLTAMIIPSAVPIIFNYPLIFGAAGLIILMSIIGSIIPTRSIMKIDPAKAIGGN